MKRLVSILIITSLLVTAFVMPANATDIDFRFGDVNMDNSLSVNDATEILRHCAKNTQLEHIGYALADFDNDGSITVLDATYIQMFLAKLIEHPREDEWLEYYVEIEDIVTGDIGDEMLITGNSMYFAPVFDSVFNTTGDKNVMSRYTFRGITDESYYEVYPEIGYQNYVYTYKTFNEPGIYEVTVQVKKEYEFGTYSYTKQFEVLPKVEFDGLRFVNYEHLSNYWMDYPRPPEDAQDLEYEMVVDGKAMYYTDEYGWNRCERFVALIHTKDEYDRLFGVYNTKFDDEFFESKSLAVAVSPGYEEYDYSKIKNIKIKDDMLYIGVSYGNNSPYDGIALPSAPTWYSFASVDKADVEHITSVQRY